MLLETDPEGVGINQEELDMSFTFEEVLEEFADRSDEQSEAYLEVLNGPSTRCRDSFWNMGDDTARGLYLAEASNSPFNNVVNNLKTFQ